MAFDQAPYHELFTSDRTNGTTVLDSDGQLKQALSNMVETTDLSDSDVWSDISGVGVPVESGVGAKGKARYLITEDTSTGTHRIRDAFSYTSGKYFLHSFDAKSNGRNVRILLPNGIFGTAVQWTFDLDAGTAAQVTGGTNDAAFITPLGDDEYRIDLYAQATNTSDGNYHVGLLDGSSSSYTGDGSSGVYLSRVRVMEASVHAPVERLDNSDFATNDLTGWTDNSVGTGTVNAATGAAVHTGGSGPDAARMYQSFPTEVGGIYRVEFTTSTITAANGLIRAGTNTTGSDAFSHDADTEGAGTYVETFVAAASVYHVNTYALNGAMTVDNVSVTKVITDGVQLDQNGEDFVDTTDGPVYCSGEEFDGNGRFRYLQAYEGRTNLIEYSRPSAEPWTETRCTINANAVVGLDGDLSGDKVVEDTSVTNTHQIASNSISFTSGTSYVAYGVWSADERDHVRLKFPDVPFPPNSSEVFDLTNATLDNTGAGLDSSGMVHLGGSKYLCWAVATADATAADTIRWQLHDGTTGSYTGDGSSGAHVYETGCEEGSLFLCIIPTNGSAVSRDADSTLKALSEFGSRQDEFSVVVEFESAGSDGSDYPRVFSIDDLTGSNRNAVWLGSSNQINVRTDDAGDTQCHHDLGTYVVGDVDTLAARYKADDFAASYNGASSVTDSAGSVPPTTQLNIGMQGSGGGNRLNGGVRKIIYYAKGLADATLEGASA